MTRIRATVLALAGAATISAQPAWAKDCAADVTAAFEKQRKTKAFRMRAETKGDAGPVTMQVDYVPPDRMHQTVRHPNHPEPIETIAIGRWAWGTMGGGWEELQPQFAQSVTAHMREALVEPLKVGGAFECLGTVTFEGQPYLAYRSSDRSGGDGSASAASPPDRGPGAQPASAPAALVRTVYVDAATGLPMFNVVAEARPGVDPVFKGAFSYPAELKIDAPIGEPK